MGRSFVVFLWFAAVWFCSPASSFGAEGWKEIIATNDLARIADIMASEKPRWPCLRSNQSISIHGGQDVIARQLVGQLRAKMREFENRDAAELHETIAVYGKLRRSLVASGGIQNLCLASSVDRIALSHICSHLIANPARYSEAEQHLGALAIPPYSPRKLAEAFNAEALAAEQANPFDVTSEDRARESLHTILGKPAALLSDIREMVHAQSVQTASQNTLLYYRSREVALMNEVFIPALITFLKRGGQFADVRLDDVSRFKAIMGSDRENFSNAALGIRRLYASHLQALIDEYAQGLKQSEVYHSALK